MPGFPPFRIGPGGPQPEKPVKPSAYALYGVLQADDSATVYIDIQNTGGECFSSFSANYLGEGEAWTEFYSPVQVLEWAGTENLEWSFGEVVVEGATC